MDSGLEERILPSIRRSLIILIYRNDGVDNLETFGQIACAVGRLPIRFTVGTGGTIRQHDRNGGRGVTTEMGVCLTASYAEK